MNKHYAVHWIIVVERFSPWLYLATIFLALFLGVGKRRAEFIHAQHTGNTPAYIDNGDATKTYTPTNDINVGDWVYNAGANTVTITNRRSQNLFAECLLKTLGATRAGEGSFGAGAAEVLFGRVREVEPIAGDANAIADLDVSVDAVELGHLVDRPPAARAGQRRHHLCHRQRRRRRRLRL